MGGFQVSLTRSYNSEYYHRTKYLHTKKARVPDMYKHWVRMINSFKPKMSLKKRRDLSRFRSLPPTTCKSRLCMEQRERVIDKHYGVAYRLKFNFYDRCKNCVTFWPKGTKQCPCCGKYKMKRRVSQASINNTEKRKAEKNKRRLLTGFSPL